MNIKTKFDIGQLVSLKHDIENLPRAITGISIRPNNTITYNLISSDKDTWHYEFEIKEIHKNKPIKRYGR